MKITEQMFQTALEMVKGVYKKNFDSEKLSFKGQTINYDTRQNFRQAMFEANPEYSAYVTKSTGTLGPVTSKRKDFDLDEAKEVFNKTALHIISSAYGEFIKTEEEINTKFKELEINTDFYGNGMPPNGAPSISSNSANDFTFQDIVKEGSLKGIKAKHTSWEEFVNNRGDFGITD